MEVGGGAAVAELVANPGAGIAPESLGRVLDRFGNSPAIQEPLVHRDRFPVTVAERLVALVSRQPARKIW